MQCPNPLCFLVIFFFYFFGNLILLIALFQMSARVLLPVWMQQ